MLRIERGAGRGRRQFSHRPQRRKPGSLVRSLKKCLRRADTSGMDVFRRAHTGSRAPRLARDEPLAAIFAGTPPQVAGYLAQRMVTRPETLAPLTAELAHLAKVGGPGDSLSLVLGELHMVTVRP